MRTVFAAAVALVLASAAAAWKPISSTPLRNIDRPAVLRTYRGTELVAWDDGKAGLWLWSSKAGTRQVETIPSVNQPQLVQQLTGAIQIYVGSGTGVLRYQSTDEGATWTGPFKIVSPTTTGPVESAAVRKGDGPGVPMFTQDSTAGTQSSRA